MRKLTSFFFVVFSLSAIAGEESWSSALVGALKNHFPKSARIEVENVRVALPIQKRFRIWGFSPELPLGLVGFQAEVQTERGVEKVAGTATVHVFVSVAVSRSAITNGEAFTGDNVAWEEREISRLVTAGYFTDKQSLLGRSAKGFVNPGQTLSRANTQAPYDVTAGQSVELTRLKGSLVIQAQVRAMQNGAKDQWIQVQNPSTGKILMARVTGIGEVRIQ